MKKWATFNETIVFIGHGYITGSHPPSVRNPARAIQACHHVFVAHAMAVKAFRGMEIKGEIGFVNVLQPHSPLTNSAEDIAATELADAIHTHWLYDPVLKGRYPDELLAQTQALWGVPRFAPGDDELLRNNRCDFIGLNYYRRETVSAQPPKKKSAANRVSRAVLFRTQPGKRLYRMGLGNLAAGADRWHHDDQRTLRRYSRLYH